MKGVVLTGNRQLEIREFPKPKAGPGQVLIKMKVAAICGSDLHHYRRDPKPDEILYISGHEPCGIVEEAGAGVTHIIPGQRAALYHYQGCGTCGFCAAGLYQHCDKRSGFGNPRLPGSDAEYMVCDGVNALVLPDKLSFIDGSFVACIAGTAYRALKKLNLNAHTSLCIYGLGPVGLTALVLAKAMRPKKIICVDPNPERRELGKMHGADYALDSDGNTVEEIISITGGGAECSFETSGSAQAQKNIIESSAHFGRVAVSGNLGIYDTGVGVNLSRLISREIEVFGSYVISLSETHELMAFMADRNVSFDSLVTHRFPLEKAKEAFEIFDGNNTGKVIFEFE